MNTPPVSDELRYRLLKHFEQHPDASQRDLARALGVSVGKVNYCIRALIVKGWVKVHEFKNHRNKSAYMYGLTPKGVRAKVRLTYEFLRWKLEEHDLLIKQIESLRQDIRGFDNRAEADPKRGRRPSS